jgi:hypothetical protein
LKAYWNGGGELVGDICKRKVTNLAVQVQSESL